MKQKLVALLVDHQRKRKVSIQKINFQEKDLKEKIKIKQMKNRRLKGDPLANRFVLKFRDHVMEIINRNR